MHHYPNVQKIYDQFVEKAVARASKRKVGSPWEEDSEQGPQVHTASLACLRHLYPLLFVSEPMFELR